MVISKRIAIVRGDTNEIPFVARDSLTNQVIDLTGASITFTAKETWADSDADAKILITGPGAQITVDSTTTGLGTITVLPADTTGFKSYTHQLVYDIRVKTSAGKEKTGQLGALVVVPDATISTA